jgi:hypothetical protein
MLFSGPHGSVVWTTTGYNNWVNASRDIPRHECSREHHDAEIALIQWRGRQTINQLISKNRSVLVDENRKVVERVLDCIKFLACEMIAFWGDTPTEAKFMNLFRLVATRDASAAAYMMKVDKSYQSRAKMPMNFLSSANVRLALSSIKELIVERIVEIATQKKACIIFNSTQDFSKKGSKCSVDAVFTT